jgi:hypothetical protein
MTGGGSQNTVSQNTVPDWLQPYLTNTLSSAQTLEQGGGPQYYPGQQVASLTPLQNEGLSQVQNLSQGPNASTVAQNQNMNISITEKFYDRWLSRRKSRLKSDGQRRIAWRPDAAMA